jgi:quinohemoprotein ethanol dehydrogenase
MATLTKGFKNDTSSRGFLRAWSVKEHRVVWEAPTATSWDGGVMATASGVVFQGDANGYLNAYSADSGVKLAAINLGTSMMAAPMTYRVNGTQYVAIIAGYGAGAVITGSPFDPASAADRYGNDGRVIALKLDGPTPPLPPAYQAPAWPELPPRPADAAQIAAGEPLYNRYCSRCHVFGHSILPDLRRMSPATHALFDNIVLEGAYAPKGMGRFNDVLTPADAHAIHAYITEQAWAAKTADSAH